MDKKIVDFNDLEVPNKMFDNIVNELKEKGVWVEDTDSENSNKAYALLSDKDKIALWLGKERIKKKRLIEK